MRGVKDNVSDKEANDSQQRLNDSIIDVRNEAIAQGANLYLLGRQLVLASVGLAFLGVDAAHAFAQRAVERGEIAETDAQKMAADLQQQARDRVEAANQARIEVTEKATASLLENANGILKRLGVPPMKVEFPGTPEPPSEQKPTGTASEPES